MRRGHLRPAGRMCFARYRPRRGRAAQHPVGTGTQHRYGRLELGNGDTYPKLRSCLRTVLGKQRPAVHLRVLPGRDAAQREPAERPGLRASSGHHPRCMYRPESRLHAHVGAVPTRTRQRPVGVLDGSDLRTGVHLRYLRRRRGTRGGSIATRDEEPTHQGLFHQCATHRQPQQHGRIGCICSGVEDRRSGTGLDQRAGCHFVECGSDGRSDPIGRSAARWNLDQRG